MHAVAREWPGGLECNCGWQVEAVSERAALGAYEGHLEREAKRWEAAAMEAAECWHRAQADRV